MYRLRATNHADALTRREQDLENQAAAKIAIRTQALLRLEQLDLRIQAELASKLQDQDTEICPINAADMDFIDELL
jgi:hypothetical protein